MHKNNTYEFDLSNLNNLKIAMTGDESSISKLKEDGYTILVSPSLDESINCFLLIKNN